MNFITLKELKKMVPVASEFKRVPGLKKILEDGIEVVLRKQMENHAEVVVYKNGYVSYHAHERYTVFESMEKNCGMSDGEIESEIIRNYVMSLPPEERAAAGWTLNQISLQEADRLGEYVHQRDPSWNWGKPVKPGILDDYKSGMNILI